MTVSILDGAITEVSEPYVFTALDRCDGTAALSEQAYHRATKDGRELFFCNHHYSKSEYQLLLDGWTIESDVKSLRELGNPLDVSPNP